jgi:hypothetical protein
MTLGINGLGNSKSNGGAASKQASNAPDPGPVKEEALVDTNDALALKAQGPATSSRQLARDYAEKFTRLAAVEPAGYDQLADNIGTATYLLVDTVNRLCRDTQAEPLEERMRALNMIQHVHGLPDDFRQAIEEDLRRTSAA